jgi:hypothetical protein
MKGSAMNLKLTRAELRLEPHQVVGLRDAEGTRVQVRRGRVWITQDRDGRDLLVAAGNAFTLDRPGLALLHALERADVALSDPERAPSRLHRSVRAFGRWIAFAFGPESLDRYRPGPWHLGL